MRILGYGKDLAHLTVVMSIEGTKNRMPKFSIGSEDDAGTTD
jgi:hypothetical protein